MRKNSKMQRSMKTIHFPKKCIDVVTVVTGNKSTGHETVNKKPTQIILTKAMSRLLYSILVLLFSCLGASSQNATLLRGTVLSEAESPMAGVTISVKTSAQESVVYNAVTGTDGAFEITNISASGLYNITATAVGYTTAEIPAFEIVAGQTNSLLIRMQPSDSNDLRDIIVVGYGTQRKVTLTGAVTQVSGDDLRDRPVTNISQMLQGTIPNLNIRFGGGAPGTMGSINVRGVTSISGNNALIGGPLVLIDGVPGTLDRLSPEEIQTITVLKDAASAAVYGARGGFGVVLVTTKAGAKGKALIRYNNAFGFNTPNVSTDFMTTAYDWMRLNDRALAHVGGYSRYTEQDMAELYARRNDKTEHPERPWATIQRRKLADGSEKDIYVYYGNYDWWNLTFTKWQPYQNHNINISGGTDKVQYMINGNAKMMDGILRLNTDKYKSYGLRTKVAAQLYPWLKVSQNLNFYNMNYAYWGRQGGANANFVAINVHASPAYAPWNPDGTAFYRSGLNSYDIGDGIYSMLLNGKSKGVERKYELTSISEAVFTPVKDLIITANYSYNMYTDPSFYRTVPTYFSLEPGLVVPNTRYATNRLIEDQQFNQSYIINAFAEYTKRLGAAHNFKLMAGFNQEHYTAKKVTAQADDILSEDLNDLNLATTAPLVRGGSSAYALQGYFYRLNYDYKGKYLLETSGRYDGSSRFPKNDRWGFFPSVSAGWRASEETFWRPVKNIINDFKIRGSVGALGNQDVSNYYPYILTMNPTVLDYILDGERPMSYRAPNPVSGNLTWERITTYNSGLDIALFQNRLSITYDKFVRYTRGMLSSDVKIPNVFGASQPLVNVADLKTNGFELSVNWTDNKQLAGKPFRYSFGAILADSHSEIIKINNPTQLTYTLYEGKKIGEIWGYITDGYFKTDAEAKTYPVDQTFLNRVRIDNNIPLRAGDLRWVDLDGDGKITQGDNTLEKPGDQRVIGNSTPRYTYGINGSLNWAGFDVSVFFQGLGKMNWYPGNNADRFWGPYSRPYFSFIPADFEKNVYSAKNPNAYFPNLLAYVALNANNELRATNNKYLQDLAYIRLKNLTLGYKVPQGITKRAKIQDFRIFVSGENLFTWTKLRTKYIDPEQAMANIDGRVYPFSKTYSFGIDITF